MDYDHVSSDSRRIKQYSNRCQPDRESLAKVPYNEDPKLAFVINSILAVVHGLDKMHKQVSIRSQENFHGRNQSFCANRSVMEPVVCVRTWFA